MGFLAHFLSWILISANRAQPDSEDGAVTIHGIRRAVPELALEASEVEVGSIAVVRAPPRARARAEVEVGYFRRGKQAMQYEWVAIDPRCLRNWTLGDIIPLAALRCVDDDGGFWK